MLLFYFVDIPIKIDLFEKCLNEFVVLHFSLWNALINIYQKNEHDI